MSAATTVLADLLSRSVEMYKAHLGDFSDAEMFARSSPKANHAAWQLGQVISSDHHLVALVDPKAMAALPEGFDKKFTKETAGIDDPSKFPNKQQLLEQFAKTRNAAAAWVRTLSDEQLNKALPEKVRPFAKTVGEMAAMMSVHSAMHLGQIQAIRRKLGKPVLF